MGVDVIPGDARDGVVSAPAPGVAAADAFQREPQAETRAVQAYGLDGILRAGGHIAATGWFER